MANTFKSAGTQNIGTSITTVYTAPGATTSTVIGFSIANVTASTITVDAKISKSAVETFLVKGAPIPPGGALVVIGGDQKLVLETGNLLRVTSSVATSADAIVSVLEAS